MRLLLTLCASFAPAYAFLASSAARSNLGLLRKGPPALVRSSSPSSRLSAVDEIAAPLLLLSNMETDLIESAAISADSSAVVVSAAAVSAGNGVVESFQNLWGSYNVLLETEPYNTDVATSASMYCVSETVSSAVARKLKLKRLVRFLGFGVVDGNMAHFWYHTLDTVITGNTPLEIAEKVVLDSSLYTSIYTALFLLLMPLMDGKGWSGAVSRLRGDYKEMVTLSVGVWAPYNVLLYSFVPLEDRVLCTSVAIFLYTLGLSWWDAKKLAEQPLGGEGRGEGKGEGKGTAAGT